MSYAVLSLPYAKDLKSEYYFDGGPENMRVKAEAHAQANGLKHGDDFKLWQPMTTTQLKTSLDDIRQRTVVLIDAHGNEYTDANGRVTSKIKIPASAKDHGVLRPVYPDTLGLRDSSIELLVAGVCFQRPEVWESAVPPGCVVIGYSKELFFTHYPLLFERFVDLPLLLKDGRIPNQDEESAWLEHIVAWFEQHIDDPNDLTDSKDWFITTGK